MATIVCTITLTSEFVPCAGVSLKMIQLLQHFEHLVSLLAQAVEMFTNQYGAKNVAAEVVRCVKLHKLGVFKLKVAYFSLSSGSWVARIPTIWLWTPAGHGALLPSWWR